MSSASNPQERNGTTPVTAQNGESHDICEHHKEKSVTNPGNGLPVCPICFGIGIRFALLEQLVPAGIRAKTLPDVSLFRTAHHDSFDQGAAWLKKQWMAQSANEKASLIASYRSPQLSSFKKYHRAVDYYDVTRSKTKPNKTSLHRSPNINFHITGGMNGESYHGLLAALLTNGTAKSPPVVTLVTQPSPSTLRDKAGSVEVNRATAAQIEFLQHYLPSTQLREKEVPGAVSSRRSATEAIAAFFKANPAQDHPEIFRAIRDYLNDAQTSKLTRCSHATPASLGIYYMNQYLALTGQNPLPTRAAAGVVVTIVVRRKLSSRDGRLMDSDNVVVCMQAAIMAFKHANNGQPGTIVLMGDIESQELPELKEKLERAACPLPSNINLLCISSPFFSETQKLHAKETALWGRFKGQDCMPTEVSALGFYLGLRELYEEDLAVVGWRSGFLDGAGFMGIPQYWLDDKPLREELKVSPDHKPIYDTGLYLYRSIYRHPKNANDPEGTTHFYTRGYDGALFKNINKSSESVRSERMEELAATLDNFILIHVPSSDPPPKYAPGTGMRLNNKVRDHLAAALSVYSMADTTQGRLWKQRVKVMADTNSTTLSDEFNSCPWFASNLESQTMSISEQQVKRK